MAFFHNTKGVVPCPSLHSRDPMPSGRALGSAPGHVFCHVQDQLVADLGEGGVPPFERKAQKRTRGCPGRKHQLRRMPTQPTNEDSGWLHKQINGICCFIKITCTNTGVMVLPRPSPRSRCRGKYKIKQRYVHFFFLNEFLHLLAIIGIAKLDDDSSWLYVFTFYGMLNHHVGRVLLYMTFYLGFFLLVDMSVFLRRLCRPARRLDTSRPRHPLPTFRTFTHTTRDGLKLKVQRVYIKSIFFCFLRSLLLSFLSPLSLLPGERE